MIFENIESQGLKIEQFDLAAHLKNLHDEIGTSTDLIDGCYQSIDAIVDYRISKMLEINDSSAIAGLHSTIMDSTKEMLYGVEKNGFKTMGLSDLTKWTLNPDYRTTNIKQQAGYAAEILSTYKENLRSRAEGSDLITYRADDLPELFPKNDQYVDKVRMNSNDEIVERIQTKFFGNDGEEWLSKMMSKKNEKYLDSGKVDKLECPKDFYKGVKETIQNKVSNLEEQLERVKADGKTEVAEKIQRKIDKYNKIDEMVEQSNTTKGEATFARLHPKCAAAKTFVASTAKLSNREGLKSGAFAAALTFTVSSVDHVSAYMDGEITAEEMVKDITKETAAAGALGYGTAFISTAVSQTMSASSSQLIRNVGGSCLPAAISFAVESYDSITSFAKGEIDGGELAYDLGENGASIAGGIEGAMVGEGVGKIVGGVFGTAVGPLGTGVGATVGGFAGSLVGGVVGCAVTSEIYATAVEAGADHLDDIAGTAQKYADSTVESIKEAAPEKLESAKNAINDFASSMKIPIHV